MTTIVMRREDFFAIMLELQTKRLMPLSLVTAGSLWVEANVNDAQIAQLKSSQWDIRYRP